MAAREYEFYLRVPKVSLTLHDRAGIRFYLLVLKVSLTLHDRAGIRVLSSRAESISHSFVALIRERYSQHSK